MDDEVRRLVRDGQGAVSAGQMDRGLRLLRDASDLALARRDQSGAGYAMASQAAVLAYRRQVDAARPLVVRALEILPAADVAGRALALDVRATLAWLVHDIGRARRDFEGALSLYRADGDARGEGRVLGHLGLLHRFQGNYREADRLYGRALKAAGTEGTLSGDILCGLAESRLRQGDHRGAAEALEAARSCLVAGMGRLLVPRIDLVEAALRLAEGHLDPARALALSSLEGAEDLGDPGGASQAQAILSRIAHLEGRGPLALHLADQAWGRTDPPDEAAYLTLYDLGGVWREHGQADRAREMLDRSVAIARRAGAMHLLAILLRERTACEPHGSDALLAEAVDIERSFGFTPPPPPEPRVEAAAPAVSAAAAAGAPAGAKALAPPAASGALALRLFTLGEFRVEVGGMPVPDGAWHGRRPRLGLVLLAAHPRGLTRAELAESLGMDESAPAAVHVLVGRIRSAIGRPLDAVQTHEGRYRLNPALCAWWDAERLEGHAAAAGTPEPDPAACERILDLYGGPFLPAFDDFHWVGARQARLHGIWLHAAAALLQADAADRDWDHALALGERILAIDPLAEAAHRAVLAALWNTGRRSAARSHFDALRRRLADTLDTEPEAATLALWQSLGKATHA